MHLFDPGTYVLVMNPESGDPPFPGLVCPDDFVRHDSPFNSSSPRRLLILAFGPPHKLQWAKPRDLLLLTPETFDLYENHSAQHKNAFTTARLGQMLGLSVEDWKRNLVGDRVFERSTLQATTASGDESNEELEGEASDIEDLENALRLSVAEQSQTYSSNPDSWPDEDPFEDAQDDSPINNLKHEEGRFTGDAEVSIIGVRQISTPSPSRISKEKERARPESEQVSFGTLKNRGVLGERHRSDQTRNKLKRVWESNSEPSTAGFSNSSVQEIKRTRRPTENKETTMGFDGKNVMDSLSSLREGMKAQKLVSDIIDETSDNDIFAYVYVGPENEEFKFLRKDLEDKPYFFNPRAGLNRLQKAEIPSNHPGAKDDEERSVRCGPGENPEVRWTLAHPALKTIDPRAFQLVAQFLSSGTFGHCRPETSIDFKRAFAECVDVLQVADLLSMSDLLDAVADKVERFLPYWDMWSILVFAKHLYKSEQVAFPETRRVKRAVVEYIVENFRRYMEDDALRFELLDMLDKYAGLDYDFTITRLDQVAEERPEHDVIGDSFGEVGHSSDSETLDGDNGLNDEIEMELNTL